VERLARVQSCLRTWVIGFRRFAELELGGPRGGAASPFCRAGARRSRGAAFAVLPSWSSAFPGGGFRRFAELELGVPRGRLHRFAELEFQRSRAI